MAMDTSANVVTDWKLESRLSSLESRLKSIEAARERELEEERRKRIESHIRQEAVMKTIMVVLLIGVAVLPWLARR